MSAVQRCTWCIRVVDSTNRSDLSEEAAGSLHAFGKPDDEAFCTACEEEFFTITAEDRP